MDDKIWYKKSNLIKGELKFPFVMLMSSPNIMGVGQWHGENGSKGWDLDCHFLCQQQGRWLEEKQSVYAWILEQPKVYSYN